MQKNRCINHLLVCFSNVTVVFTFAAGYATSDFLPVSWKFNFQSIFVRIRLFSLVGLGRVKLLMRMLASIGQIRNGEKILE